MHMSSRRWNGMPVQHKTVTSGVPLWDRDTGSSGQRTGKPPRERLEDGKTYVR